LPLFDEDHDIDVVSRRFLSFNDIRDHRFHSILGRKAVPELVRIESQPPIVSCGCQSPVFTEYEMTVVEHCGSHGPNMRAERVVKLTINKQNISPTL